MADADPDLADLVDPDEENVYKVVESFGAMSPDEQRHWMHRFVKTSPVSVIEALLPRHDPRQRAEIITQYKRLQAMAQARELHDEVTNSQDAAALPDPVSLTTFLAEPDEDVRYRVDQLWPSGGRVVLSAQNKSGKTTLTGNLVRSLADGDRFLGKYDVQPADRVVLIDNEMSEGQIRRWLRDQGIVNTDAVTVVSLRGRLSTFNILDPGTRAKWAWLLGQADALVFDCLRPALDALGLSEDKESGRFLEALDELCHEAGIPEMLLVHHMGHGNERSRGDSRLEDWPDAKWKLVKEDGDDPTSDRYFAAFGRDVDQPEARLAYNPDNRHLRVDGGSRSQNTSGRIALEVEAYVLEYPGASQSAIERAVIGDNSTIRAATRQLVVEGQLRVEQFGQTRRHYSPLI